MDRQTIIAPIVQTIRAGTNLPARVILEYLADWEVVPALIEGEHVATAMVKGTEIHFALVPGWRPRASHRGRIREFLTPLLERYGFLTTRVQHVRAAQNRFVKRLGFKPTWKDDQVTYYLLGTLPFERNK